MATSSHVTAANPTFALKLFGTLANHAPNENLFFSPISIALALALAYNGARGDTRRAIAAVLDRDDDPDDVNRANAELAHMLTRLDQHVQLTIANSLWVSDIFRMRGDYAQIAERCYGAEVRRIDFAHMPVAQLINDWVNQQTHGKIARIVDDVDRDAMLILINAIYFKGGWTEPFNRQHTQPGHFTLPGGRQVERPMMAQRGRYRYYEERGLQAVCLPYGGGRVGMYVFLPPPGVSLAEFGRKLSAKSWAAWMQRFSQTDGRIVLPRFRAEYAVKLNDALGVLGMGIAFEPRADFGAMAGDGQRLRIDEVRHKAFVEVNEEGTEAAAVTSVGMMRASFMPQKSFSMIVDRPFVCAICDEYTGAILFMGAIVDPA